MLCYCFLCAREYVNKNPPHPFVVQILQLPPSFENMKTTDDEHTTAKRKVQVRKNISYFHCNAFSFFIITNDYCVNV